MATWLHAPIKFAREQVFGKLASYYSCSWRDVAMMAWRGGRRQDWHACLHACLLAVWPNVTCMSLMSRGC
jgi:hypothetical protein